ncbi:hypothetical protein CR513_32758, partial [Mucuna pruriens]
MVIVKKSSGKWRMFIDYMNLNKACPKDLYPLPSIDTLVDGASSCDLLSFMDAHSSYNQIWMHPCDKSKTAFIMNEGNICYRVMPFGLKNVGATYQRLMDRIFKEHIGNQLEVYVDEMMVKSATEVGHVENLASIFGVLRWYQLKLNPEKCLFEVKAGKGVEENPEKCNAVIHMRIPKSVKEHFLVIIANNLQWEQEEKLLNILRKNKMAFGWTLSDFPGINPSICMHKILLEEEARPIRQ